MNTEFVKDETHASLNRGLAQKKLGSNPFGGYTISNQMEDG